MLLWIKKISSVLTLLFILGAPSLVFAQQSQADIRLSPTDINYTPLVPLPGINKQGTNTLSLNTYIPGMFNLTIGIAGVLAVLMIVFGGVEYITSESLGGKSNGRDRINNAIIGLVLIIGSYAILATINPKSLQFDLSGIGTPSSGNIPTTPVSCPVNPCSIASACRSNEVCTPKSDCTKQCTPREGGNPVTNKIPCIGSGCYGQHPAGSVWPSDATERGQLSGFRFWSSATGGANCRRVDEPGCTTVYRLGNQAISGLQALKNWCNGCTLTITGGSEFWEHSSHGLDHNRVDLDYTAGDGLDRLIRTNGNGPLSPNTCIPNRPNWPAWSMNGAIYVLEDNNHWHVCYSQSVF